MIKYNEEENDMQEKIEKAAARAFEMEDGKTVLVDIGGTGIRCDYRCMDKETEVCDKCRLKFKCYTSQYLIIEGKELRLNDIGQTLNEKVEAYVTSRKGKRSEKEAEDVQMPTSE